MDYDDRTKGRTSAYTLTVQLDRMGRERSPPGAKELKSTARYEAHLDRQYYHALHELQELQARRRGDSPLPGPG